MNQRGRILIVDDDPLVGDSLKELLRVAGHEAVCAGDVDDARAKMNGNPFDLLLLDVHLPGADGFELLQSTRDHDDDVGVIMMTGYGTIPSAVRAIREGAYDYLTKPLSDKLVGEAVRRALTRRRRMIPSGRQHDRPRDPPLGSIVGEDPRMLRIFEMIEAVADSDTTILITGESGTGKSLIARCIHDRSKRNHGPFVEVSCGAIPEGLLESELFGHVRGAFTGAVSDKQGRFWAAHKGTVFLDEIDAASPALQIKLLRVLQERCFEPVGSSKTVHVDVRIVLATNADLATQVREGRFRQDLYYRINVVDLSLPPLRQRGGDIPLLADYILRKLGRQTGKTSLGFTDEALEALQAYHWPGNVRELENALERAVLFAHGPCIGLEDLPAETVVASSGPRGEHGGGSSPLKRALQDPEKQILEAALRANNWNRKRTAEMLQINRTTLYKKMKRYGLMPSAV